MNGPSTAVLLDGDDDFLVSVIGKLDTFSISLWLQSYRYYVGEWPQWRSTIFDYSEKQVYGSIDGISGAMQVKCGTGSEEIRIYNRILGQEEIDELSLRHGMRSLKTSTKRVTGKTMLNIRLVKKLLSRLTTSFHVHINGRASSFVLLRKWFMR